MNKRKFLGTALSAAVLPAAVGKTTRSTGPALLTVSGAISRSNRGALDPALDQMMKKQGLRFPRAYAMDYNAITALPAVFIRPTLEYDAKPHRLEGPLLTEVIKAAGARPKDQDKLLLRAIDGYAVALTLADIRRYRLIVATHLDGRPMPLGGLGPLWAIYDADRYEEMSSLPLNERFGFCPWGLYHIDVQ